MTEARDKYWFIKREVEHRAIIEIDSLISTARVNSIALMPSELTMLQLGQSYIRHVLYGWEGVTNALIILEEERLEKLEMLKKEQE